MKTRLIIESGSTKADWLLYADNSIIKESRSIGLNPKIISKEVLKKEIHNVLKQFDSEIESLSFYGAGVLGYEGILISIFKEYYPNINIDIKSDLIAAANASFSLKPRLVCILGTGSYIGKFVENKLVDSRLGHGYVLGDICSGSEFGKYLLRDYLDNQLTGEMNLQIGLTKKEIHEKIYRENFPNRFLASFFPILVKNRTSSYSSKLIKEQVELLYKNGIHPLKEIELEHITFIGGVANQLQAELKEYLPNYYTLQFIERPIQKLFEFHISKTQ